MRGRLLNRFPRLYWTNPPQCDIHIEDLWRLFQNRCWIRNRNVSASLIWRGILLLIFNPIYIWWWFKCLNIEWNPQSLFHLNLKDETKDYWVTRQKIHSVWFLTCLQLALLLHSQEGPQWQTNLLKWYEMKLNLFFQHSDTILPIHDPSSNVADISASGCWSCGIRIAEKPMDRPALRPGRLATIPARNWNK